MDTNPAPPATALTAAELTIQLDPELLAAVRSIADQEGRAIRAVVENALGDFVSKTRDVRKEQMWRYYQDSLEQFGELYRRLAQ